MKQKNPIYYLITLKHLLKVVFQFVCISLLLASCEDPYLPVLDSKYENVLVVDGMITNEEPPYTITLSMSSSVNVSSFIPVSNYEGSIWDDQGNQEILTESEPGVYVTSANGMKGVVGTKYQLVLHSPSGDTYESEFEKLAVPVGIDSLYAELEYRQSNFYPYSIPDYQFYVDTHEAPNDSSYILWSMDETYKFESDYLIYFYYDGILHDFPKRDSLKTCWYSGTVSSFFVENTLGLSDPHFTHYPLHFVDTQSRRISIRYSVLLNQYAISARAYKFWNDIKEQNAGSGELFYSQPFPLRGNVKNISNPDGVVLGYFMVAGSSQKRIYVDRPNPTIPMYYPICELSRSDYEAYGWMFLGGPLPTWPLYITQNPNGARALPEQECIDCTKNGGKLEKPDFWVD